MKRLLLLMATRTYRARPFMRAAHRLGAEVVVGSERQQALARLAEGRTLALDFSRPERAAEAIATYARTRPLDAIVGVDDDSTLIATLAGAALGLPGNAVAAVEAAQNKYRMRELLAAAGLPSPRFALLRTGDDPATAAAHAPYPCVLKPVFLAASRGVIRADDPAGFVAAFQRIRAILDEPDTCTSGGAWGDAILVESFIPGFEVALEGLLDGGVLRVLALFDKPDPLDGPYFEETIYVTPSRLPAETQAEVSDTVVRTAAALGLREGPVHAELRINAHGVWVVEIAPRSIGGLCSTALQFGTGLSLEDVILRHALGADIAAIEREREPAGVMMLPIPARGILREVRGREAALAVAGIESLDVTIPPGEEVVPLPEGDRYLGFLFARGATPMAVEASLREAHARLAFVIDGEAGTGTQPAHLASRALASGGA